MAWSPISGTFIQYSEDDVDASSYYLKFYAAGTTTPIVMATDSTGGTTLDKCQLDTDGMPINGSGGYLIPYIDQKYKLVIYRNSTDADANTFANAYKEIDDIDPFITSVSATPILVATVAVMTADTTATIGDYYQCADYDTGNDAGVLIFEMVAVGGTADNLGALFDHDTLALQCKRIFNSVVNIKEFGYPGDGTDAAAAITAAIAAKNELTAEGCDQIGLSSTVTVTKHTTLDLTNVGVIPLVDVDMFHVNEGGQLKNLDALTSGITYTSVVSTLKPVANIRGGQYRTWLKSAVIEHASGGAGDSVLFDATLFYIQECNATDVSVYWGNKAVAMTAGAGKYCNGNVVNGLITHDPVYSIYEADTTETIQGNVYSSVILEDNLNGATVQLNTGAKVDGQLWDRVAVIFKGDFNEVTSPIGLFNDELIDEGYNNRIRGQDVAAYENKRTILKFNDYRNNLVGLRGRGEYRDDFMAGKLGNETLVNGTGTTAFQAIEYGSSAKAYAGMRCILTTLTTATDSMDMRWQDTALRTGHDPIYHCTAYLSETADTKYQFGFYRDSNNYILFESDVTAGTITPRVKAGGVETAGTAVSVTFGRVFWMSIVVTNDEVIFNIGEAAISSNNMGDGIYNFSDEQTITTNIPTAEVLQPRTYVETETAAAKQLSVLDVHVSWCHGYLVP